MAEPERPPIPVTPGAGPVRPPRLAPTKLLSEDGSRYVYACPYGTAGHWGDWAFAGDLGSEQRADLRYRTHCLAKHPQGDLVVAEDRCTLCRGPLGLLRYRSTRLIGVYCSPECRSVAETRPRFAL